MIAQAVLPALVSPLEYLHREREAKTKHEYVDGIVCEMAGAGRAHTRLTKNLHGMLYRGLGNGLCENSDQDVKVWIAARSRYYYPDASIACPPNFIDDENGVIDNPTVVVEVLSPSTSGLDRGPKFADYRTLPTFRDYVLIDNAHRKVEVFSLEGEAWMMRIYEEGRAFLPSVGIELDVDELYRRVPLLT